MSLLPEEATYLEHVQAYFLTFRGDGVSLSPLDAELLADWRARGVPYPVVCRGIRKTAESHLYNRGSRLRTLRSCRLAVEREFLRWEGRSAAPLQAPAQEPAATPAPEAPTESFAVRRMKKARAELRKALRTAPSEAARLALEAASGAVASDVDDPRQVSVLIARAEDLLALVYLRRLPLSVRLGLMREARSLAGPRPARASPRARKDALRAHRVALARAHGTLPALS
jgi:hypothetical protein